MIKRSMDAKLGSLSSTMGKTMDQKLKATANDAQGWKLPFIILVVLLLGGCVGLYLFYMNLKKTHML